MLSDIFCNKVQLISKVILGAVLTAYVSSMFFYPLLMGNFFATLHSWQSLNAGILALVAALIGVIFAATQYSDSLKRERIANNALLPDVIDVLQNEILLIAKFYREKVSALADFSSDQHRHIKLENSESLGEFQLSILKSAVYAENRNDNVTIKTVLADMHIMRIKAKFMESNTYISSSDDLFSLTLIYTKMLIIKQRTLGSSPSKEHEILLHCYLILFTENGQRIDVIDEKIKKSTLYIKWCKYNNVSDSEKI